MFAAAYKELKPTEDLLITQLERGEIQISSEHNEEYTRLLAKNESPFKSIKHDSSHKQLQALRQKIGLESADYVRAREALMKFQAGNKPPAPKKEINADLGEVAD